MLLLLPTTVAPLAEARKLVHDPLVRMANSSFIGLNLRSEALLIDHFEPRGIPLPTQHIPALSGDPDVSGWAAVMAAEHGGRALVSPNGVRPPGFRRTSFDRPPVSGLPRA